MIVTSYGVAGAAETGTAISAALNIIPNASRSPCLHTSTLLLNPFFLSSLLTRSDVNRNAFHDESNEIVTSSGDQRRLAHTDGRVD